MQVEHDNFVGTYDGAFSKQYCENLISLFEWNNQNNRTYGRPEQESVKKDQSVNMNPSNQTEISFFTPQLSEYINEFNEGFWNKCYKDYTDTYSTINSYENHTIYTYKIQKTEPSGGYHVWHCEDAAKVMSRRIGVYILYLNEVDEGGETEFLYLKKRIKAKQGRLVIFPPNYPWTHRGNPPLTNTKYIMTGWVEFS